VDKPAVLIVEDEPNQQETLSTVLALVGFRTVSAANVEEALLAFGREQIDAVTLDVKMPDPKGLDRDGLTLLKYLRSVPAYADLPVLMFTGADLKDEEEALIAELRGKLYRKPQPYGDIIDELTRLLMA
jgi:CheY-like chemotaxis protein